MKKTCNKCDKMAVWNYAPKDSSMQYCDEHVSRGCSCNYDMDENGILLETQDLDSQGREYPCCEFDYCEKGFDVNPTTDFKVYMDDLRPTPDGWERTYTVDETIAQLETRCVTHLSLDNDLGEGIPEGYKVVDWLEEKIYFDETFPLPVITVHSSNASRVEYMRLALQKIERIRQEQVGGS